MNRREFAQTLGSGALAMGMGRFLPLYADNEPQLAITIDDFNTFGASPQSAEQRNRALLGGLHARSDLKAAAFICGKYIDSDAGSRLARAWGEGGHMVANHTYSHWRYPGHDFQEYTRDILRAESLIKGLPGFTRRFRFPELKEGNTAESRDAMRAFLREEGYAMGYVTIDASDWYIDGRLRAMLAKNPKADTMPYRDYYLNHIWDRATYYDGLARRVLGRSVRHTLLIHHNLLNELFLGDLLDMFRSRGWKLIDAADAFTDPLFSAAPNIVPAGESIVWALARESGRFDDLLRYPGEDGEYEREKMDGLGL